MEIGPEPVDTPWRKYVSLMNGVMVTIQGTDLRTTCRAIVTTCLEPSIHALLVEHMPTGQQPQILFRVIVFQTDQALRTINVNRTFKSKNL
jgi:hypothetical protein